ncbi:MAG: TetR/AcrR family transcriptional regulator [Saprospiraceae bacterium]|nr:TetR/AcrR family transcriptional regulator [Saprospiraceae bacterium]
MAVDKKQVWIDAGYDIFASEGPQGLKVELLSRKVKKSKSSFYHHFADLDLFVDDLLAYHVKRGHLIVQAAQGCQRMNPDFLYVMLDHRQDLFFQRQLRIHRQIGKFAECIKASHWPVEDAFLQIWAKSLNLEKELFLAQAFLRLMVDNFYMRITEQSMDFDWLADYLQELTSMVKSIEIRNKM